MTLEAIVAANEVVNRYSGKLKTVSEADKEKVEKLLLKSSKKAYSLSRTLFYSSYRKGIRSKVIGNLFVDVLKNLEKVDPSLKGRILYELGQVHQTNGDFTQAITSYGKVPKDDKKYGDAQYNICYCYVMLSKNAGEKGDDEAKKKYQVKAIDSLKAVIGMKRVWKAGAESNRKAWEKKRSQCFILLAQTYATQGMNKELLPLADQWFEMYKSVYEERKDYEEDFISLYRGSIYAAISFKNAEEADRLFEILKKQVLRKDNRLHRGKYKVPEEIGLLFVNLTLDISKLHGELGNDEKRKYYEAESVKFEDSAGAKSILEQYRALRKYEKNDDIYNAKAIKLLDNLKKELVSFKRTAMLSEDYLDTIYFKGDKKKSDSMKKAYRDFVYRLCGKRTKKRWKVRINYYTAGKKLEELIAFDPDKKLKLWKMPLMKDIEKNVTYYKIRQSLYKKLWPRLLKKGEYKLAVEILSYLMEYYPAENDYKINAAVAFRKTKQWKKALTIYAGLIAPRQKSSKQVKYRYLVAVTHYEAYFAMKSDANAKNKEKIEHLEKALRQLGSIQASYPEAFTEEMKNLKEKCEAALKALR